MATNNMAHVANNPSKPNTNSIKQTNNFQPNIKTSQKKRGRSLTRQLAVKGNYRIDEQDLDRSTTISESQEEKSILIKSNKQAKNSPTKYTSRKQDVSHTSLKSPTIPKTPNYDDAKKPSFTKYNENKNSHLSSRASSNNASLASSREQTPKVPTSSKSSPHENKQG